jgi:glycine cleavage system H protein
VLGVAVWARRVDHSIYRLGLTKAAADAVGGIGFLDLAEPGSILTDDRPFGMAEGSGGMLGLFSRLSGEITEINAAAVEDPLSVLGQGEGDAERGWLVEVDGYLDPGDPEDEWDALRGC